MRRFLSALVIAMFAVTSAALADSTASQGAPAAGMPMKTHLVFQFGVNQPAAESGDGTGTTTFDIVGVASDGGLTVNATDNWWMAVHPKQTTTCEVYPNGNVTCSKPPYGLSVLQASVMPLLGRSYFSQLSTSPTSSWKQNYKIKATFLPGVMGAGFAGQVYTWNGTFSLTGKGTYAKQPPLLDIHSNGSLKQEGGRYTEVSQKATFLYDPRIQMPVYVDAVMRVVPQQSVNSYSVEMKLIRVR